MISVKHRFHGYGSLNHVYRKGTTVRSQYLSLKYVQREHKEGYRIAVVVSRKVHKSAVVRNRIRRRIYEIIRHADPQCTSQKDMILTVFSDHVADMPTTALQKAVEGLLKKPTERSNQAPNIGKHAIVKPKGRP